MFYELRDHFIVNADIPTTWAFFSRAQNLPRITPPSLRFTILTPEPITIADNARIDYTIRWAGIPIRWRTLIVLWQPPHRFVDMQIRGPYAQWHHEHAFTPTPEGTQCTDRVIYRIPGGIVGQALHALTIRRQLLNIFRYRRQIIGADLGLVRAVLPDVTITPLR